MKKSFINLALVTSFTFFLPNTYAQVDSAKLTYSEERKDSSDYRYRRLYQYLDINMKDEQWMFKVSPDFSLSRYNKQFGLQLSFEHKIYRQFSILINNRNSYYLQKVYQFNYFGNPQSAQLREYNNFFHSNIGAGLRCYFNLDQRIKNGISGNNLSGFYAEIGLDNIAYYSDGNLILKSTGYPWSENGFHVMQNFDLRLALGFQRRFNNWSYFDIFTTSNLVSGALYWDLGFRIGFAWGK